MTRYDSELLATLTEVPKVRRASVDTSRPEQSAAYDSGFHSSPAAAADMRSWTPGLQSEDQAIHQAGELVPARVIDQVHNDGMAAGAAQRIDDNTIGTGLKLSMSTDWESMGITKEQGQQLNTVIEREFRTWTRSSRNSPDITRKVNWPGQQVQASRGSTYYGEILAVFEPRRSPMTGEMQTAVRIVDSSRLSDPQDNPGAMRDKDIRSGIEYNSEGAAVAYWISSRQKGELVSRGRRTEKITWKRYPKWGRGGRQLVFHAFDPTRAEQSRGISPLAATVRAAKMLDRISDATLQAALLQTLYALVIKSNANWKDLLEVLGTGDQKEKGGIDHIKEFIATRANFYRQNPPKVNGDTSARAVFMLPDEDMEVKAAKAANPEVAAFINDMRAEVARGSGMSLEAFTGDYSKTNYSSSRMGNHETHKVVAGRRARLLDPFLSWVLEHFVDELFIRKPELLPAEISFYDHRDALTSCTWIGAPPTDPDPEKTAKAAKERLGGGYSTLKYECAILGLDWQEVLEQQAAEADKREALGLLEAKKKEVDAEQPTPPPQPKEVSNGNSNS